ncbi:carbohydrate ABC transporter permease [Microbacterium sp. RD1]|uniref:carbohydrate ABC transporter permease n=1 Tax=Microbacterium sp. RD1 TaxID=3457313 RepID=UPI003FA5C01A
MTHILSRDRVVEERSAASEDARRRERRRGWAARTPLLPALLFVVALTQIPFVITLVISFTNWNALYPRDIRFVGIDNFIATFVDERLRGAVVVSVVLTVGVVLVCLVLGMIGALLLDRHFPGRGLVRTLVIAPFLFVPVATALMWKHVITNPEFGLVNGMLTVLFGAGAPQPDWVSIMPLVVIGSALVWQWTPFVLLILLAGLQSRPLDVREAAQIDGANAWQMFRYMTLPHLRRYLELAALLCSLFVVQSYDAVSTITAGSLGTANMPYVIYQGFFRGQEYGQTAASGVVIVFATLYLTVLLLRTVSSLLSEEKS